MQCRSTDIFETIRAFPSDSNWPAKGLLVTAAASSSWPGGRQRLLSAKKNVQKRAFGTTWKPTTRLTPETGVSWPNAKQATSLRYAVQFPVTSHVLVGQQWLTESLPRRVWGSPGLCGLILSFLSLRQLIQLRHLDVKTCNLIDHILTLRLRQWKRYPRLSLATPAQHSPALGPRRRHCFDMITSTAEALAKTCHLPEVHKLRHLVPEKKDCSTPNPYARELVAHAFQQLWEIPTTTFRTDVSFYGLSTMRHHAEFLRARRLLFKAVSFLLGNLRQKPPDDIVAILKDKSVSSVWWRYLGHISDADNLFDIADACFQEKFKPPTPSTIAAAARCVAQLPDSFYTYAAISSYTRNPDTQRRRQGHNSVYQEVGMSYARLFHWLRALLDDASLTYHNYSAPQSRMQPQKTSSAKLFSSSVPTCRADRFGKKRYDNTRPQRNQEQLRLSSPLLNQEKSGVDTSAQTRGKPALHAKARETVLTNKNSVEKDYGERVQGTEHSIASERQQPLPLPSGITMKPTTPAVVAEGNEGALMNKGAFPETTDVKQNGFRKSASADLCPKKPLMQSSSPNSDTETLSLAGTLRATQSEAWLQKVDIT